MQYFSRNILKDQNTEQAYEVRCLRNAGFMYYLILDSISN